MQAHRKEIVELIARKNLPAVYPAREFVETGGLIAYAIHYPDLYFRFARQIDKIFHGADPRMLPVEQPTKCGTRYQSQDGESTRTHDLAIAAAARRRGNSVIAGTAKLRTA